jgi:hypothetical protein
MKYCFLLFVIVAGIYASGCNTINPEEKVPTYIHLDTINFVNTNPTKEGTTSQNITSAWVYFNNNPIGVFDLPATVPILADAPGQVSISAGVAYSGLGYASLYPFFNSDTFTLTPAPGTILKPKPTISYVDAAVFTWKEDFETGNAFINTNADNPTDTSLVRTNAPGDIFEGGGSGVIYLDANHPTSENISNNGFPIKAGQSFIELNYKCNTSFQVGLQTSKQGAVLFEYIAGVKAKESWNKVYIGLSNFTGTYQGAQYRIMIKAGLDNGLSNGYVLLDNIKVISY